MVVEKLVLLSNQSPNLILMRCLLYLLQLALVPLIHQEVYLSSGDQHSICLLYGLNDRFCSLGMTIVLEILVSKSKTFLVNYGTSGIGRNDAKTATLDQMSVTSPQSALDSWLEWMNLAFVFYDGIFYK